MRVLDLSYHPLDVRSGGWVDLSRKGNHGTPHGGARPYMIAPGVVGYWFDGSSGYMKVSDSSSLRITDAITVGAWVNLGALGAYQFIVSKRGSGLMPYELIVRSVDKFSFQVFDGSSWYVVNGVNLVSANAWYYIVGGFNGTNLFLYDNGEEILGDSLDSLPSNTANVAVGRAGDASFYYFNGLIAQPVIENRAWSEAEVRENMYRSPIYHMLRGLPYSVYISMPQKQTQGGIYVP